ncbi:MAG: S-layer homology domain-containing protein [Candidatus Gracilibacteria bacterium]
MTYVLRLTTFLFASTLLLVPLSHAATFTDIYSSDPLNESLDYLISNNVVEGYDDSTFRPLNLINRAEFTKMIVEGVIGETPDETLYHDCFPDVTNDWYAKYVCYAEEQGWIQGYTDGSFKPGDNITRAEAVKILDEAYGWELSGETYWSEFGDNEEGDWYYDYLLKAEERGLFDKLSSYISPHELISRRQMSVLLYRAMKYEAGEEFEVWSVDDREMSYEDVLATGITAAYPSSMSMTTYSQSGWPYACYGFAVKNLTAWKYGEVIDMTDLADTIGWDGSFIWDDAQFSSFAENYDMDLVMTYYGSAEFLLKKLAAGEPVVLYIPYYIGEDNVGHQVMAYSFDADGVWTADSLYGGAQIEIGYDQVFVDGAVYTTNITDLRRVKDGGMYKMEW